MKKITRISNNKEAVLAQIYLDQLSYANIFIHDIYNSKKAAPYTAQINEIIGRKLFRESNKT